MSLPSNGGLPSRRLGTDIGSASLGLKISQALREAGTLYARCTMKIISLFSFVIKHDELDRISDPAFEQLFYVTPS